MSNIVEADFKIVQERTLPVIAGEILQIEENVGRVALDGAIRIGERLKEAKEKVEHGQWENWCRENLNYSKSKTEKLMKIATEYGNEESIYSKTYMSTDLSISKALSLLQVPEDKVEKFVTGNPVDDMTVKELEEEIRKLKKEKLETEEKSGSLEAENKDLKKEVENLKSTGADPEKISELEKKISSLEKKNKALKAEAETEKAEKDKAIEDAIKNEQEKIRRQVEEEQAGRLNEAEEAAEYWKNRTEIAEEKVEKASNEATLIFKVKADSFQEAFADCLAAAEAADEPERLKAALKTVTEHMLKELEG